VSPSFHLPDPEHFTTGTVGPPGQRTFYLQVAEAGEVVSFKLEKQQVAALAEYLGSLLADLPELSTPPPPAPALIEPVEAVWTVGGIGIAVDDTADRIILVVHEFVPEPDDPEEAAADEVADLLAELAGLDVETSAGAAGADDDEFDETDGALARVRLTRHQAVAFIDRATELMSASRPLCPFCGLPRNVDGSHDCPREN
jgi:uncharacterized repeat protein (TIGR03847 family)